MVLSAKSAVVLECNVKSEWEGGGETGNPVIFDVSSLLEIQLKQVSQYNYHSYFKTLSIIFSYKKSLKSWKFERK